MYEKVIENAGCRNRKEYDDKKAKESGFKNNSERIRIRNYETGRSSPKELNEDCSSYFGDFTENLMIQTFEDVIRMPPNNPGFDWKCMNEDKIDNKGRCLKYSKDSKWSGWQFEITYNIIADWFILSAWDNRNSLRPPHVWAFHKNDIVRGRKFWERDTLTITNTQKGIKEFDKHEVTHRLDKLKKLLLGHIVNT